MGIIQEKSIAAVEAILEYDYYIRLFESVLAAKAMTRDGIRAELYSDEQLVSMWNSFWWHLPDSGAIRRPPFDAICDLCESMYDEPDDFEDS